ncbi:uncharacterized protein LOC144139488 isoform X2 [Haemaphysalis longicornis]
MTPPGKTSVSQYLIGGVLIEGHQICHGQPGRHDKDERIGVLTSCVGQASTPAMSSALGFGGTSTYPTASCCIRQCCKQARLEEGRTE